MYVDFKFTCWERIEIPPHCEKEVLERLKSGLMHNCNDFCIRYGDKVTSTYKMLEDTQVQMRVLDNNGFATIEVHKLDNDKNDQIIWANGNY